jgi:hypothetical protein
MFGSGKRVSALVRVPGETCSEPYPPLDMGGIKLSDKAKIKELESLSSPG